MEVADAERAGTGPTLPPRMPLRSLTLTKTCRSATSTRSSCTMRRVMTLSLARLPPVVRATAVKRQEPPSSGTVTRASHGACLTRAAGQPLTKKST